MLNRVRCWTRLRMSRNKFTSATETSSPALHLKLRSEMKFFKSKTTKTFKQCCNAWQNGFLFLLLLAKEDWKNLKWFLAEKSWKGLAKWGSYRAPILLSEVFVKLFTDAAICSNILCCQKRTREITKKPISRLTTLLWHIQRPFIGLTLSTLLRTGWDRNGIENNNFRVAARVPHLMVTKTCVKSRNFGEKILLAALKDGTHPKKSYKRCD